MTKMEQRHGNQPPYGGLRDPGRRQVLRAVGLGSACAGIVLLLPAWARAGRSPAWERLDAARERLDGTSPRSDSIRLELPAVSRDGSAVPLTVEVDSPMTADDYVEALYLYAAGNPTPELAEFRFSPLAGRARVTTRIRLDESQAVVALARTTRGEWLATEREVRVTVSGCFARDDTYASEDRMHTRVRVPEQLGANEPGEVLTLINHPMETGLRENDDGQTIPQRIIRGFRAELDGESVLEARLHRSISANPYLRFHLAPQRSGELFLLWEEDTGETATATARIQVI